MRAVLSNLEEAETYLQSHGIAMEGVAAEHADAASLIREVADTHEANLIVMGGYSHIPLVEIVLGSTVNDILRTARRPTLICQ
jgi:nucleotide-binding universal stress UspA family protein